MKRMNRNQQMANHFCPPPEYQGNRFCDRNFAHLSDGEN
jgi:hypothetical protein